MLIATWICLLRFQMYWTLASNTALPHALMLEQLLCTNYPCVLNDQAASLLLIPCIQRHRTGLVFNGKMNRNCLQPGYRRYIIADNCTLMSSTCTWATNEIELGSDGRRTKISGEFQYKMNLWRISVMALGALADWVMKEGPYLAPAPDVSCCYTRTTFHSEDFVLTKRSVDVQTLVRPFREPQQNVNSDPMRMPSTKRIRDIGN